MFLNKGPRFVLCKTEVYTVGTRGLLRKRRHCKSLESRLHKLSRQTATPYAICVPLYKGNFARWSLEGKSQGQWTCMG